ncbi:MAG: hypothetical protein NTZ49_06105 [Candidatus Parcubacteria bacterium]|nr:hypothetical protein [Candidatus Parcubacteria bacterium]
MKKSQFIFLMLVVICLPIFLAGCGNKIVKTDTDAKQLEADFNIDVPLPNKQAGNLKNVPKEEIDTLFDNIKK